MFRLNKIFILAGGIFIGFIVGQIWDLPYKYVLKQSFLKQYGNHVFHCDNAMKQHFIAKSRLVSSPSTETINSLKSAELGLIDCHEYDKFRKFLITLGLSENNLAHMALKAIESNDFEISNIVNPHEITF